MNCSALNSAALNCSRSKLCSGRIDQNPIFMDNVSLKMDILLQKKFKRISNFNDVVEIGHPMPTNIFNVFLISTGFQHIVIYIQYFKKLHLSNNQSSKLGRLPTHRSTLVQCVLPVKIYQSLASPSADVAVRNCGSFVSSLTSSNSDRSINLILLTASFIRNGQQLWLIWHCLEGNNGKHAQCAHKYLFIYNFLLFISILAIW